MRSIKFRAWNLKLKRMVYNIEGAYDCIGSERYEDGEDYDDKEQFFDSYLDDENYIVMQFTGLKDKNGKEIYEGDIVLETTETEKKKYEVVWIKFECSFEFKPINFKTMINYNMGSIYTEIEVIGNIYENPELLDALELKNGEKGK